MGIMGGNRSTLTPLILYIHCYLLSYLTFIDYVFKLKASLPLGVHFFCLPKRNRTKEKGTLIALLPKTKLCGGVGDNSLRSNTRPLIPPNSIIFGGDNMGIKGIKSIHTDPIDLHKIV
jgi:hypothetical protein